MVSNEAVCAILLADNDADFLETRAEFLENAGYRVFKAYTLEQAQQLLADVYVHLSILDIRMMNDDDERDRSGLNLARNPVYRPVPKIMLTGFPTYQDVREALGPVIDGLPPAVNFLSKKEGPQAMIRAVEQTLDQHVRVNWNLHINWDQHPVSLLRSDLPGEILMQRAAELEDLIRRLFYDYRQVRIGRLFWQDGWRFCLAALAQSAQGATDPRILVCGERERLKQEVKRMQELAPQNIQGTKLVDAMETMHFGGLTYALPDADVETVQTLNELFQRGRERSLKAAFDHLLQVLSAWHQRGQMVDDAQDLMACYRQWAGLGENGLSQVEVNRRVDTLVQLVRPLSAVEVERSDGTLTFYFPNEEPLICPDPVAAVYAPLERYDSAVIHKISAGQLAADNVLVDARRRVWLTDFACAGQSPQWWDFVCLEAIVRFDLSQAPDLLAWQEFEECLVTPSQLHGRLREQDVIFELRTSVALIEQIRRRTGSETGPDTLPYYAGLLAWTVGEMARYEPTALYTHAERMRGAHLMLAAAMIAWRLTKTLPVSRPGGILSLDSDDTVWIGDRRVDALRGQELELLRCLYERAGQLVNRQLVAEFVLGEEYQENDKRLESRINSLVRRLRVKIEPNPDRPRYILTVKGRGYRLQVGG
jgi:DNA-binding response OmpR family regulator